MVATFIAASLTIVSIQRVRLIMEHSVNFLEFLPAELILRVVKYLDCYHTLMLKQSCWKLYRIITSSHLPKFDYHRGFIFKTNEDKDTFLVRISKRSDWPLRFSDNVIHIPLETRDLQLHALAATQRIENTSGRLAVEIEGWHIDNLFLRAIGRFHNSLRGQMFQYNMDNVFINCTFDADVDLNLLTEICAGGLFAIKHCSSETGKLITSSMIPEIRFARTVVVSHDFGVLYDACNIDDRIIASFPIRTYYALLRAAVTSCTLHAILRFARERLAEMANVPRAEMCQLARIDFGHVCCDFSMLTAVLSEDLLTHRFCRKREHSTLTYNSVTYRTLHIEFYRSVTVVTIVDCCCRARLLYNSCSCTVHLQAC